MIHKYILYMCKGKCLQLLEKIFLNNFKITIISITIIHCKTTFFYSKFVLLL